jgi:hypothetical protein
MRLALGFLVGAVMACFATPAAAITFRTLSPMEGTHVGKQVSVVVITSERATRVEARVETVTGVLQGDPEGKLWMGRLSLEALARGPKEMVVTAHPEIGAPITSVVPIVRNDLPRIVLQRPVDNEVARPQVRIVADCFDDDDPRGCVEIIARHENGVVLASGRSRLDASVSLEAWQGRPVLLTFEARDGDGASAPQASVQVLVDASPRLVEVDRGPGIVDADTRKTVLCGVDGLQTRNRQSGVTEGMVTAPPPICFSPVVQTEHGVLYSSGDEPHIRRFLLWQGIEARLVGLTGYGTTHSLAVSGDFASWTSPDGQIEIAHLGTGVARSVTAKGDPNGSLVATNFKGEVVYLAAPPDTPPGARVRPVLYRSRADGVVEKLREAPATSVGFVLVADDGVNTAYIASSPSLPEAYLYKPDGDELLSANVAFLPSQTSPRQLLQLAGGWIAYTKHTPGPQRQSQLRLRSPAGMDTLVYDGSVTIEALSAAGDVMFIASDHRLLSRKGAMPEMVSTPLGKPVARDDAWLIMLGNSLFQVEGTGPPGSIAVYQPPDGGATEDASASADAGIIADASMAVDAVATATEGSGHGCSCQVTGRGNESLPQGLVIAVLLLAAATRRLRQRRPIGTVPIKTYTSCH